MQPYIDHLARVCLRLDKSLPRLCPAISRNPTSTFFRDVHLWRKPKRHVSMFARQDGMAPASQELQTPAKRILTTGQMPEENVQPATRDTADSCRTFQSKNLKTLQRPEGNAS